MTAILYRKTESGEVVEEKVESIYVGQMLDRGYVSNPDDLKPKPASKKRGRPAKVKVDENKD